MTNLLDYQLESSPINSFKSWLNEAKTHSKYWDHMTLATADQNHNVDARVILFKYFTDEKIIFFTNYQSKKSKQISDNSRVCLLFWWPEIRKQVRIKGIVEKTSRDFSIDYFEKRDKSSQIVSSLSMQSQKLDNPEDFKSKVLNKINNDEPVFCPENWGGYQVIPDYFEFFIYGDFRLNDRIAFSKSSENSWDYIFLYP